MNDNPQEQWQYLPGSPANTKLAIFVHGFQGNYITTWGDLNTILAAHADADPTMQHWDFLFLGYPTAQMTTYLDISAIIGGRFNDALRGDHPFNHPYDQFALIGHSLGTLGIRQFLCEETGLQGRDKIVGACLICPVEKGTDVGTIAKWWSTIAKALTPMMMNPQLRMLQEWTRALIAHNVQPVRTRIIMATGDPITGDIECWPGDPKATVIPYPSNRWQSAISRSILDFNVHINTAKVGPTAWRTSTVFGKIHDTLSASHG